MLVASDVDIGEEKNSTRKGVDERPSMASDPPCRTAGVRLLDELKAFEFGEPT